MLETHQEGTPFHRNITKTQSFSIGRESSFSSELSELLNARNSKATRRLDKVDLDKPITECFDFESINKMDQTRKVSVKLTQSENIVTDSNDSSEI